MVWAQCWRVCDRFQTLLAASRSGGGSVGGSQPGGHGGGQGPGAGGPGGPGAGNGGGGEAPGSPMRVPELDNPPVSQRAPEDIREVLLAQLAPICRSHGWTPPCVDVEIHHEDLGNPDKTTKFPAEMVVDYVRV